LSTRSHRAAHGGPVRHGFGRKHIILILAGALTAAMLGWQGWHIYQSYQAVAHKESGKCATKLVEEVYFAATLHGNQLEDLEHGISAAAPTALPGGVLDWSERFARSGADLEERVNSACDEIGGTLLVAVRRVDMASSAIDSHVDSLVASLAAEDLEAAQALLVGPAYGSDRAEYTAAVDSLVSETRKHLEVQLGVERRSELTSVTVAFGIFALALGAWALFLRRIRSDQLLLAAEERQRREAEAELLQAQKLDAMGTMAGEIAHDFNNLITAIWGSATAARDHLATGHPALVPIRRIEQASEQANDVVSGLLAFGRRAPARLEPVELGTMVWETGSLLHSMMPDSIELVIEGVPGDCRWVMADRTQLQQVLINIVLNARDAMAEGGRLSVRTRCAATPEEESPRVCLEVTDTGHGMTADVREHIFEPFFSTRQESGSGTGLGLAIAHGIVASHEGTIHVDSTPGSGTRVVVELPAIEPPDELDLTAEHAPPMVRAGGATILLTEDHRHVREIMAESLEGAGYEVVQAESGDELLDTFAAGGHRFDLLIVDLDIPGPNGLDCLQQLRSQGVRTPAVLVTGTGATGLEEQVGSGTRVLRKPFPMPQLQEAVAEAIQEAPTGHERV
jgi:signal transduction histidine kinase/ActR/RegA family two-component response regulator